MEIQCVWLCCSYSLRVWLDLLRYGMVWYDVLCCGVLCFTCICNLSRHLLLYWRMCLMASIFPGPKAFHGSITESYTGIGMSRRTNIEYVTPSRAKEIAICLPRPQNINGFSKSDSSASRSCICTVRNLIWDPGKQVPVYPYVVTFKVPGSSIRYMFDCCFCPMQDMVS